MTKPAQGKAGFDGDPRDHRTAPADRVVRPWPDEDCRVCHWRTPWIPGWCWRHTRRMTELGYQMEARAAWASA